MHQSQRIDKFLITKEMYITGEKDNVAGDYISNLTLDYTINQKKLGLFMEPSISRLLIKMVKKKNTTFKTSHFHNYARL